MPALKRKPAILISYAHADEPEMPTKGEVRWLSFVMGFLQPAVKSGEFSLWVDRQIRGSTDWEMEIGAKLRACDIFVLLVSRHSLSPDHGVDEEIAIIRERQERGEDVHFYPLLLTPTPKIALDIVRDRNLRPHDGKPLSSLSLSERSRQMAEAANEIARVASAISNEAATREGEQHILLAPEIAGNAAGIIEQSGPIAPHVHFTRIALTTRAESKPRTASVVHISGLPETGYERLVGRDAELKRLDDAWSDGRINIVSLVAEGGAGKSALVNEWLTRLQTDRYRGADCVLGWSFYSQGSKERATSADEFLNWALEKLSVTVATTSASAKGEAIAEALMRRPTLLLLDGVEPMQHGPGPQRGQLKDQGLRALLRRFAPALPGATTA